MRKNSIRISRHILLVSLILVGIIFLLVPPHITGKFHDLFIYTFSPILKIGTQAKLTNLPGLFFKEETVSLDKYNQLLAEKDNIEVELKSLQRKYLQLHELYETSTGTRQRLPDVGPGHIWAEVINFLPEKNEININRGSNDGLKDGLYVIGQDYLIGVISQVSNYSAKVKLLTSPDIKFIVEIEAKDEMGNDIYRRALMSGDGGKNCKIGGVKTANTIKKDNFVYAYALPGFLNSPLIIGKVSNVKHNDKDPLFWDITVEPLFDAASLKRVFAVTMDLPKRSEDE